MAKLRKADRIQELWGWLLETFPVRRPIALKLGHLPNDDSKSGYHGYVIEHSTGKITMSIDSRPPLYSIVETMIHEYAHIKSRRQTHCMEFRRIEYKINEAYEKRWT